MRVLGDDGRGEARAAAAEEDFDPAELGRMQRDAGPRVAVFARHPDRRLERRGGRGRGAGGRGEGDVRSGGVGRRLGGRGGRGGNGRRRRGRRLRRAPGSVARRRRSGSTFRPVARSSADAEACRWVGYRAARSDAAGSPLAEPLRATPPRFRFAASPSVPRSGSSRRTSRLQGGFRPTCGAAAASTHRGGALRRVTASADAGSSIWPAPAVAVGAAVGAGVAEEVGSLVGGQRRRGRSGRRRFGATAGLASPWGAAGAVAAPGTDACAVAGAVAPGTLEVSGAAVAAPTATAAPAATDASPPIGVASVHSLPRLLPASPRPGCRPGRYRSRIRCGRLLTSARWTLRPGPRRSPAALSS